MPDNDELKTRLVELQEELDDLQQVLHASQTWALLLVFQAADAAGKDSTIRAVLRGVDPAGVQVFSFKQPNDEELSHDFLWRTARKLPARGQIGVFNRSYYEEVLVVRVHPEFLKAQRLPIDRPTPRLWQERYESIRDHEHHLVRNGTVVLKFWLNVSKEEQRKRFLDRLEEPEKNWKFSEADVAERRYWREYTAAYEHALNATSREWAPWYAIPADSKPYMRVAVADVIVRTLRNMKLEYPKVDPATRRRFAKLRRMLLRG
jgi:PPK2 family polyphosphate:nucleotide phosphotransferase